MLQVQIRIGIFCFKRCIFFRVQIYIIHSFKIAGKSMGDAIQLYDFQLLLRFRRSVPFCICILCRMAASRSGSLPVRFCNAGPCSLRLFLLLYNKCFKFFRRYRPGKIISLYNVAAQRF